MRILQKMCFIGVGSELASGEIAHAAFIAEKQLY
jgi:hypothetical protein